MKLVRTLIVRAGAEALIRTLLVERRELAS
jgi:hypothetical protein